MIEAIKEVLKGIDQTELESTDGWWETSAGAEFGAKKLKYILGLLAQPEQAPVALKPCWYESKQEKMCRKCGQVHAEAISPPQRKPLTDDEIAEFAERMEASDPTDSFWREFARAIEAAYGIKE